MAGKPGRSGRKAISIEDHLARGTYRPDRHAPRPRPIVPPLAEGDRRRVLAGLSPAIRRQVAGLLDRYDWEPGSLPTLREYALSLDRLRALHATAAAASAVHRELRVHAALVKLLDLDR